MIGIKKIILKNYNYETGINVVFGGSGLIGECLKKIIKKNNFIFISKNKKKNFLQFDLDKDINKFPYQKINKCFFLASPRVFQKNFKNNIYSKEFDWLKKVILHIKINKLIYLSSSSVYYKKQHIIGLNKNRCENLILKFKKKFKYYQIWRPFNLVGIKYYKSDHFHNILFRKMFIENRKRSIFYGNLNDSRAYTSVHNFAKTLNYFSNKNLSFIKDFGNIDLIKIEDILKIFNKYYKKINKKFFKYKFLNKKNNTNVIKENKSNICINTDSKRIFRQYLKKSLNVNKL